MRILLVNFYFPPYNQIGAVRLGKFAKYLIRHGHEVRVLCAHRPLVVDTLALEIDPALVRYTSWANINALPMLLLGGRQKVVEKGFRRPGLTGQLLSWLGRIYWTLLNIPDGQIGWLPYALRHGSQLFSTWRPDIIYVSSPPTTALLVGHMLSRRHGVPWVAEMRDLWTDNPVQLYRGRIRQRIEHWLERRTLSTACGFVTISRPLAELLTAEFIQPVAVIENGFDFEDHVHVKQTRTDSDRIVRLVFTGMVYPEYQNIDLLFQAIRHLGDWAGSLSVDFYGRDLAYISQLAVQYRVTETVKVHVPVSHRAALNLQRQADGLIFFSWEDQTQPGIMSGKIYEYLAARRPILMLGSHSIDVTQMISARNAGRLLDTPEALAAQLREWILLKRAGGAIADTPVSAIAGIDREGQAVRLAEFLEACIGHHGYSPHRPAAPGLGAGKPGRGPRRQPDQGAGV